MNIRNYRPADREACIGIFHSNVPLYFDSDEITGLYHWLDAKDRREKAFASNATETYYVLEHEGKIVGCAGYYIPAAEARANMVWGMILRSEHKKGYGNKLLEYRIQKIKETAPACSITLDTSQHCYRFFEKFGFTVTKITNDAYGPGLHRYDMVYAPADTI